MLKLSNGSPVLAVRSCEISIIVPVFDLILSSAVSSSCAKRIRQHTSAPVSTRQHPSAPVSTRQAPVVVSTAILKPSRSHGAGFCKARRKAASPCRASAGRRFDTAAARAYRAIPPRHPTAPSHRARPLQGGAEAVQAAAPAPHGPPHEEARQARRGPPAERA